MEDQITTQPIIPETAIPVTASVGSITSEIKRLWHNVTEHPSEWFMAIGIYVIIGFVAGFFFKHFGRLLIFTLLIGFTLFTVLHYFNVVSINFTAFESFLGISGATTLAEISAHITELIHEHIARISIFLVGLFFAWFIT